MKPLLTHPHPFSELCCAPEPPDPRFAQGHGARLPCCCPVPISMLPDALAKAEGVKPVVENQ